MDLAKKMVREGISEGSVIVADEQTVGRGRLGRKWLSPRGSGVSLSIILRPTLPQLPQLNMVASLAVVRSIEEVTGIKSDIKWPNDILINGKKVCGILIENIFKGNVVNAAIVGIGVNTGLRPSSFPEISATATSLSAESRREVSQYEILQSLLKEFEQIYQEMKLGNSIYERWLAHVETLGKLVQVKSGGTVEEGYVESIDNTGSLLLRRSDGSLTTIVAGEATLNV